MGAIGDFLARFLIFFLCAFVLGLIALVSTGQLGQMLRGNGGKKAPKSLEGETQANLDPGKFRIQKVGPLLAFFEQKKMQEFGFGLLEYWLSLSYNIDDTKIGYRFNRIANFIPGGKNSGARNALLRNLIGANTRTIGLPLPVVNQFDWPDYGWIELQIEGKETSIWMLVWHPDATCATITTFREHKKNGSQKAGQDTAQAAPPPRPIGHGGRAPAVVVDDIPPPNDYGRYGPDGPAYLAYDTVRPPAAESVEEEQPQATVPSPRSAFRRRKPPVR